MAQRKLQEKVETWIVVSLIAALVWLYAEAKVLQQHSDVVQVRLNDPTARYALPVTSLQIRVDYKASSGEHQRFKAATQEALQIDLDTTGLRANDNVTLLIEERLMRAGLGELAITDIQVAPETYDVPVSLLDNITLPIAVRTEDAETLDGSAESRPAGVFVSGPSELINALRGQTVGATLSADALGNAEAGRENSANNVPLVFPETLTEALQNNNPWVNVDVYTAEVTFTLADNNARYVMPRVPLVVSLTAAQQALYDVQPSEQSLANITLVGPRDIIDAIERGDSPYTIEAELRMTERDLSAVSGINGTTTESPVIRGAPGVTSDPALLDGVAVEVRPRTLTP